MVKSFKSFAIKYGFLVVMVLMFVFFRVMSRRTWRAGPAYLFSSFAGDDRSHPWSWRNFTLVIDGFDLSIGAIAALTVMIASYLMVVFNLDGWVAIIIVLALGALVGFCNGFLIVRVEGARSPGDA